MESLQKTATLAIASNNWYLQLLLQSLIPILVTYCLWKTETQNTSFPCHHQLFSFKCSRQLSVPGTYTSHMSGFSVHTMPWNTLSYCDLSRLSSNTSDSMKSSTIFPKENKWVFPLCYPGFSLALL